MSSNFILYTINHKKSDLSIRNKVAFTSQQIEYLYNNTNNQFVLLSTCNRTEFYTHNLHKTDLIDILKAHSNLDEKELENHLEVLENETAIKHLCSVASGLESKILGDYEIVGQLKKAFALAKKFEKLNGYVEKIFNLALACSKEIKNKTKITNGTTSASYFAIYLLKQFMNVSDKKYTTTILGLGKIGINTLKNHLTLLPNVSVNIVNRNNAKAQEVSKKYQLNYIPFEQQQTALLESDVLIVATSATAPILFTHHIEKTPIKYIFDLSVPSNVSEEVKKLNNVKVINIDELSALVDETIKNRESQIPLALEIIEQTFLKFIDWQNRRTMYAFAQ